MKKKIQGAQAQRFSQLFYERLYRVAREENLVIFIGAGVSKIGGSLLWRELANSLTDDLLIKKWINEVDAKILKNWSEANPRKTISICFKRCDSPEKKTYLFDCIKKYCTCSDTNKTSEIYNLLFAFEAKAYVTTNIGKELIESLPSLNRIKVFNCTREDHLQLIDRDPNIIQNGNIFYLHGDIDNIEKTIFCIDNYINHYKSPSVIKLLSQIFSPEHTILFIGYTLSELEILEHLIRKSNAELKTSPRNFVLVPVKREEIPKERLNIDYYHYFDLSVELYNVGRGSNVNYGKLQDVVKEILQWFDPHRPKVLDVFNQIDEVLEGNVNN